MYQKRDRYIEIFNRITSDDEGQGYMLDLERAQPEDVWASVYLVAKTRGLSVQ